ncbi:MAG: nuclear transport factor 2 family protein [Sphingomonas sp.]
MSASRLEDEAALSRLVDLYARAVDRGDAGLLDALFTPDATLDFGAMFAGGYAAFAAMLAAAMAGMRTHHLMGNRLFAIDGDEAEGEVYSINTHVIPHGAGARDHIGAGRYLDRYRRTPDGWRFTHRTRVIDWTNTGSPAPGDGAGTIAGARGGDDPSASGFPLLARLRGMAGAAG